MAAITRVQTDHPAPATHLLWRFRPSLQTIVDSSLEKLIDIVNAYPRRFGPAGSHQERLEDKLYLWSSATADLNLADDADASIIDILSGSLHDLLTEILICPLSQTTIRNPVCFHGYVVDRNALAYRREFCGHPITNPNDYPSHPFALDIVRWTRELLDRVTLPDPTAPHRDLLETLLSLDPDRQQNLNTELAGVPQSGEAALVIAMFARMMSSRAIASSELMLSTLSLEHKIEEVEAKADEDLERIDRCIDALRADFAAREERVEVKLASAAEAQKKEVKILKDEMEEKSRVLAEVYDANQKAKRLLETRLDHAIEREHHLEGQVAGLQQARQSDQTRMSSLEDSLRKAEAENARNARKAKKARRGFCTIQ